MNGAVAERTRSDRLSIRVEQGAACVSLFDDRWDQLVRSQPLPNPALSATWLRHLIEWEDGTPVAVVAEQDDAVVAAGAFGLYRPAGRFGPMLARWLGDHRQWFSPDLLVDRDAPGSGDAVIDALLGIADAIHLPAPEHGAAAAAIASSVPWRAVHPGAEGWFTPLPPPRKSRVVGRFEKDRRRAARRGAEVTTRVAVSPAEVREALERLFVLHAARWRARGGEIPRFSTTDRHRDWYRRLVEAMAERGEVLVVEILENDEVVASELGFVIGSGAIGHTCSIRLGGKLEEPGHASQLALHLALEERGIAAVDLGLGAGDPGGPKASVGSTRVVVKRFLAAGSRRRQRALEAALACKEVLRARHRRSLAGEAT